MFSKILKSNSTQLHKLLLPERIIFDKFGTYSKFRDGVWIYFCICCVLPYPKIVVSWNKEDSAKPLLELLQADFDGIHRITHVSGNEQNISAEVLVRECLEPTEIAVLVNMHIRNAKNSRVLSWIICVHLEPFPTPRLSSIACRIASRVVGGRRQRDVRVPDRNEWKQLQLILQQLLSPFTAGTQGFAVYAVSI
jgi:hypothetical protein